MRQRGRAGEGELPEVELETWSEPADGGVATEVADFGRGAWALVLLALGGLVAFVLIGQPHDDAPQLAPKDQAVGGPLPSMPERGPRVAIVARPEQFVARAATLMPPGRYATVPLSSDELLSTVRTLVKPGQVELSLGRYSELQRGTATIDHLVWVLVEENAAIGSLGPDEVSGTYRLTNRVRIFDAVTGDALVEFSGPPGEATCPLDVRAAVDGCANELAGARTVVLSFLTDRHRY